MIDCVIIGGGIIGLSLAEELAQSGRRVQVIDHRPVARIASWAAAGILPPPISRAVHDPVEQIRKLSHRLYPSWCDRLGSQSGQTVEAVRSGGLYLARSVGERVALQTSLALREADGVRVERWSHDQLQHLEPQLTHFNSDTLIYFLPDEYQVRPTRILKALREQLRLLEVPIFESSEPATWINVSETPILKASGKRFLAKKYCVAAGPWTTKLLAPLGVQLLPKKFGP